jgi:hypothetical protein
MITTQTIEEQLKTIVQVTHDVSLRYNEGVRNTCILTSYALADVLQRLGADAYPLRVVAGVLPRPNKLYASVLGKMSHGPRSPGAWKGHLVVAIKKEWLLDPTLDQANDYNQWPSSLCVSPAVVRLNDEFWNGRLVWMDGLGPEERSRTIVRYSLYRKQHGFANSPAARPSYWKPVADRTMDILAGVQFPLDRVNSESTEIKNAA